MVPLQSRAIGGLAKDKFIFALPGSPSACKDAWEEILVSVGFKSEALQLSRINSKTERKLAINKHSWRVKILIWLI